MPEAIGVLGRIAHKGDTQVIIVLRAMTCGDTSSLVRVGAAVALEQVTGDSDALIEVVNTLIDRLSTMSRGLLDKHDAATARVNMWQGLMPPTRIQRRSIVAWS